MLDSVSRFVSFCVHIGTRGHATLLLMAGALSFFGTVTAQTIGSGSASITTPQLRAELLVHAPEGVQTGQPLWVGLQLTHQPEWHTYWRNPGDSGLPTQIELNLPPGITAGDMLWPLPHKIKAGNLTNYGFEKTALLVVPLNVAPGFQSSASSTLDVQARANWLVCRLECIPQEGEFTLRIPTRTSLAAHAAAFDAVLTSQPQPWPSANAVTRFEGQNLVLEVQGLPASWRGQTLKIFPHTGELIASAADQHPHATQSWRGEVWTSQLPLSNLRTTTPNALEFLLVTPTHQRPLGVVLNAPITQPWPAIAAPTPAGAPQLDASMASANPTAHSWGLVLAAIAGAFAGGLILNLMPCVLPVLAIKLLGFAQHSRAHRAHRIAGLAYTLGVVVSFLLLGTGVLSLRAAGEQLGWGFQLQSPSVISVMSVLFTLIALNLLGQFEVGHILPSSWVSFQYKHPVLDALLSGVLAVAVASPCTAPFMGASLGLAMTLPAWQALWIFLSMGLGLATPYLLASFSPRLARMLPHPGPWMSTLRQLLAFPMLATVIWLLWVLGQQTSLDAAFLALSALLLLTVFIWAFKQKTSHTRLLAWLVAVLLVWTTHLFTQEAAATSSTAAAQTPVVTEATPATTPWRPWSETAVNQSLSAGRPVFVDFTAAWCVTCQINKKSTLSNDTVLADFAAHEVTLLRADWTRRDPAITTALTALGRSGVPVYVLYAPGQSPQVLSELLSPRDISNALTMLPAPSNQRPRSSQPNTP